MTEQKDFSQHPAQSGFSATWEGVKHVAGQTLRWAAIGAIALGLVFGFAGLIPGIAGSLSGGLLSWVPGVGSWLTTHGVGAMTQMAVAGLTWGAIGGAVFGGLKGIAGTKDAIDDKLQDRIADYEQNQVSHQRNTAMALNQQRMMAQGGGGVRPNVGFAPGRAQGAEVG